MFLNLSTARLGKTKRCAKLVRYEQNKCWYYRLEQLYARDVLMC